MSERELTAGVAAAVQAEVVRPIILFEGEFASGTVRLWTGVGDLTWNGYTWTGAGSLLGFDDIRETIDQRAVGMRISLAGMPSDLLSLVLAQARLGQTGRVYVGLLDAAGAVITDPYQAFEGRLDVSEVEDGGDSATISVQYESRLIDLERARDRRYTDQDQQIDYPGDRGFEFVPAIQDAAIVWGQT